MCTKNGKLSPGTEKASLYLACAPAMRGMNGTASPATAAVLMTVRRVARRCVTSEIDFDTALILLNEHESPAQGAERAKDGQWS